MEDNNILKWIDISSKDYYELDDKNINALYFISDTYEIYKGNQSFTDAVELLTGEFPSIGAINKIYINRSSLEGKVYTGVDWVTVMKPISSVLSEDTTDDNSLITGSGIKLYVSKVMENILVDAGITGNTIKIGEPITIKGVNIGSYKDGDIITKDIDLYAILKNLLQTQVVPLYTEPNITTSLKPTNLEAGTVIANSITTEFTKNDAGPVTRYIVSKHVGETNQVVLDVNKLTPYIIPSTALTDNAISYTVTIHYADGPIKQDNLGQACPDGHIRAGRITKTTSIDAHRKCFYGAEAGPTDPCLVCNDVRTLPNKTDAELKLGDNCVAIECKPGDTRLTVAYPAYLPDIFYITSFKLGLIVTGVFEKSTIMVSGNNDYEPIEYKVYTYIPAIPFPSGDGYLVSIKE